MNLILRGIVYSGLIASTLFAFSSCEKTYSDDKPAQLTYSPTLYVGSNQQVVYALNPETGEKKWEFNVGSSVVAAPEVLDDGVIFATKSGDVYKLDRITGKEIVSRKFGSQIIGSPYRYEEHLYIAAGNILHQVDPKTLDTRFSADCGGQITTSPTIHSILGKDGKYVFVATANNNLLAINTFEMPIVWTYAAPQAGSFRSSPCIENDSILYIGNNNGNLYAVRTTTGTGKWAYKTDGEIVSSPVAVGGNVLIGSYDRTFYSIDSETGLKRWSFNTTDKIHASPIVFNQYVFFGSYDMNFYCIDIIDGVMLWKMKTFGLIKSSPVEYQGSIYFSSYDKNLYRVDAETGGLYWSANIEGQMEASFIIDGISNVGYPANAGGYELK